MQHVDVKVHGQVATILLDRAKLGNPLSPAMLEDFQLALSDIHQEKRVRAVVLSGSGEHFCSGIDLKVLQEINDLQDMEKLAQLHQYWRQWAETVEQLLRFPKPIVAAVDGVAAGAGLALVLACDIVVASDRAQLVAAAPRRGLVGGVTAALLAFRLGGAVAARWTLTSQSVSGSEAQRSGLISRVVTPDQIWVAASEEATRCCGAPAEAIQATKRVLNETVGEALISQISAASADSAAACSTDAAAEGISAFLEKREPDWP